MAIITRIRPQKYQKRFNLYLDGKFAFGLDAENIAKAGLVVGQELTEKEVKDLTAKTEFQKYWDLVLRLISRRPRSEKEIRDYLKRKKVSQKLVDKIVLKLTSLNYLNDRAFAEWWLEQRAAFRPRGKFGLKSELGQKGISREIISQVIEEVDETVLAKKAAAKKFKTYQKLPPREFRHKMSTFLARQGFSWEVIREVLDSLPVCSR